MIKAITFDLWDTVIRDDSDEPKRAARNLPSKRDARRALIYDALEAHGGVAREAVEVACDTMEAAFHHVWHEQHVTWSVAERVAVVLRGLGRELPAGAVAAVVREMEEMEITIPPDPVEGIDEAVAALAQHYRLAVVSDAIYTPGRCLRRWLEMHGLLGYFGAFAFSDEIGRSKPHRDMFAHVAAGLGVRIDEMLHVGDREHNDVRGPHALGMKAILFTAARDRGSASTSADAVCAHARDLPEAVARLAAAPAA